MIAGVESPDGGTVTLNKLCRIAFLEQLPRSHPENTVIEHLLKGNNPRAAALRKYELCAEKVHAGDTFAAEELSKLALDMEHLDAWDYERRVRAVLEGFGIHDLSMKMGCPFGRYGKKSCTCRDTY